LLLTKLADPDIDPCLRHVAVLRANLLFWFTEGFDTRDLKELSA
jgi:hypothetical protein